MNKIGLLFFLIMGACATTPKTDVRNPASPKDTIELSANQGGKVLIELLKKAQPPLKVKGDRIQTGPIKCSMSMGSACVFYGNPSAPSRVIKADAEALDEQIFQWQMELYPGSNVNDTGVKNITCDGNGNCEIVISGTGRGV